MTASARTFAAAGPITAEITPAPTVRLLILGAPRTKKTSQQLAKSKKTGRFFPVPSGDTRKWTRKAVKQLREQYGDAAPLEGPVLVDYQIYREANRGDLGGFEAAIDDVLQGIVIRNDSQIAGRLRSMKHVDRQRPRVEIEVSPVMGTLF